MPYVKEKAESLVLPGNFYNISITFILHTLNTQEVKQFYLHNFCKR